MKFNFKDSLDKIKDAIPKKEKKAPSASDTAEEGSKDAGKRFSKERLVNDLGKIGDFFNPEPQKERVLRHEDFNGAGDTYYANVSAFYKVAERLLWLILIIFMVISL